MVTYQHDVVVVGAGLAGMRAALEAQRYGILICWEVKDGGSQS